MRTWLGEDALIARWVAERIPEMRGQSFGKDAVAIGVIGGPDGADLLGAVVFANHQAKFRAIEWSAAAITANWLNREIINDIMRYPFEQLGCVRITAVIARKNHRARAFHERFGFRREGLLRRGFGGDDAVIYGLLRSDWAKSPFNAKRERQKAPAQMIETVHG